MSRIPSTPARAATLTAKLPTLATKPAFGDIASVAATPEARPVSMSEIMHASARSESQALERHPMGGSKP